MGLLQPETGLLFWMTLAFGVVFVLLSKYGFPVILKSIEERKDFISTSLAEAHEARQQVAQVESACQALRAEAEAQRTSILQQAAEQREQLMEHARDEAAQERERLVAEARQQADSERQTILRDAHGQVAMMAIALTERLLRSNLQDKEAQTALAEQLLKEIHTEDANELCTQV